MTVVSCMKFNEHEGAIVSDEESSNFSASWRKYDLSEKLQEFSKPDKSVSLIIGGSGMSNTIHEVEVRLNELWTAHNDKINDKCTIVNEIKNILNSITGQYIEDYLKNKFRLSEIDFQRGYRVISDDKGTLQQIPLEKYLMEQYY